MAHIHAALVSIDACGLWETTAAELALLAPASIVRAVRPLTRLVMVMAIAWVFFILGRRRTAAALERSPVTVRKQQVVLMLVGTPA
jgi:hypothetical protein